MLSGRECELCTLNCAAGVRWSLRLSAAAVFAKYIAPFVTLRPPQDYHHATGWEDLHEFVPFLGCITPTTSPLPTHPLWVNLPQEGALLLFYLLFLSSHMSLTVIFQVFFFNMSISYFTYGICNNGAEQCHTLVTVSGSNTFAFPK